MSFNEERRKKNKYTGDATKNDSISHCLPPSHYDVNVREPRFYDLPAGYHH